MRWFKPLAVIVVAAMLAVANNARAQDNETPGALVYSVGSFDIAMNFSFGYRRTATSSGEAVDDARGTMVCRCVGFFRPRPRDLDYDGREAGRVIVQSLPPGRYEIDDFGFTGTLIIAGVVWSSATPFSIPFTIHPGEATYIGNFARAPSLGTPLEPQLGAVGYFVVSDQSARDLPIARAKVADLPEVRVEVTDVSNLGHPMLYATVQH
ncbi:MAG: hypothetical protein NW203_05375 [Hyphomonadaceae bacterium]|nr:hypothetical protein [Hyphomonadaceae bacterium]